MTMVGLAPSQGGAGRALAPAADAPKARPRITTLSSMANRKKRVISHRIWTQSGQSVSLGPSHPSPQCPAPPLPAGPATPYQQQLQHPRC